MVALFWAAGKGSKACGYFYRSKPFLQEYTLSHGIECSICAFTKFCSFGSGQSAKIPEGSAESILKGPFFLFVGRLEKIKGLQTLIPIFHSYPKAQLLIAGAGNLDPHLRQMAQGNHNIRFLGHFSQRQLELVYQKAVALIVPSQGFETFGNVIIEAFRQQTPSIVRNLGGMPELIEESGGGFVYNTDEELLRLLWTNCLKNPSYRHDLGHRGYQTYKQKWTVEAHLRRSLP